MDNDFTGRKLKERAVFNTDDAGYALVNKGDAMKTSLHDVIFAIKQQNLDVLNEILYSVSDPQSSKYGNHWSRQEVAALVSNPLATESVRNYLIENGIYIEKVSKYGDYIRASATIGQWETLFQTKFYEFHDEMHGIISLDLWNIHFQI